MKAGLVSFAPELAGRVRLGALLLDGVTVAAGDPALAAEIDAHCRATRERYASLKSGEVPGVEDARTLYKALGIDPTKTRPSNEALLRRVLKGEALHVVSTLVDALNLCSLREQLPFGLYDFAKLEPPVLLRKGGTGEAYEGIRKAAVNVEGRPVLADARGPFGNPSSDSARAMITRETRATLVVAYAPARRTPDAMLAVLERTEATLLRFCGGNRVAREVQHGLIMRPG